MNSSNSPSRRSGTGLWWNILNAADRALGRSRRPSADRVADAAGRAKGMDTFGNLEQLEQRQLLAVTIPPSSVDPATGLGSVSVEFDYFIPYLFAELPEDQGQVDPTIEEFDDEMDFWTQFVPAVPPNGTFFETSDIRIAYRTQAAAAIQLVAGVQGNDPQNDQDLLFNLQNDDEVSLEFWQGVDQNPSQRVTTNARLTLRPGTDGDAIKTGANGTRLELLYEGEVVATFQGAQLAGLLTPGPGGSTILQVQRTGGFTGLRFRAADQSNQQAWADSFIVDDIQTTFPSTRFVSFVEGRRFSAQGVFTGPAGATIEIFDLYGREMVLSTFLGMPDGSEVIIGDRNADGVPDLNDGIGRIVFSNVDARTSFTLVGGPPSEIDQDGNRLPLELPNMIEGMLSDFEQAGFGFDLTNDMPPRPNGLPDGSGSVLIGSPIVRNNANPNAYLLNNNQNGNALNQIAPANFNRADQGIFVNGSMGSLVIHGMVFGSSVIQGSIGALNTGVQMGSITVGGDAGYIGIASDAGLWQQDDVTGLDPRQRFTSVPGVGMVTNAQIVVGRTLRELSVGGRMGMSVQVLGDINNPSRPPLSFIDYPEREVVYAINPQANPAAEVVLRQTLNTTGQWNNRTGSIGQATFFGTAFYRNDTLQNAEYVGYNGTAVRISGALGARDPINGEDFTDAYAFAADPSREIVVEGVNSALATLGYVRIVDRRGLTVAAYDTGAAGRGPGGNSNGDSVLRFRPTHADVYYLVLNVQPDEGFGVAVNYTIAISGMAPTTVGAITTAAGVGDRLATTTGVSGDEQFVATVNAGAMGLVRVGVGITGPDGMQMGPGEFINTNQNADDLLDFGYSSISIPGNLYAVVAGSDIAGANIAVGRAFGTLVTGVSPVAGTSNQEGDLTAIDLRVGESIAVLDINGAVSADQDPTETDSTTGLVRIRTGTRGGRGDIGQILVGAYVIGATTANTGLHVETSPGSVIGQFLVLDNPPTQLFGPNEIRGEIPRFTTGVGSDIRFADFGLIQRATDPNLRIVVGYNQPYTFVDDAGASYTVSITGGAADVANGSFFVARTLPVDGSQGVVLARLEVTLLGGANLNITATGTSAGGESGATISIGRIIINPSTSGDNDGLLLSQVLITSAPGVQAEIDVWRIDAFSPLARISNTTRGRNNRAGDIVAVDALFLDSIDVSGNLGLTETVVGPRLIGPFLGLAAGAAGDPGSPLPVSDAAINRDFIGGLGDDWDSGEIFVPIQVDDYIAASPLEDVGSPLDPYLNGLIVRNGDLDSASAGAALGDVIVAVGDLFSATANSDGTRPFGAFEGIIGSIYANSILAVDVGDGLRGAGPSPFAAAGIFANEEIIAVNATRIRGALIEGVIIAADADGLGRTMIGTGDNARVIAGNRVFRGIGDVNVTAGTVRGAFIQSVALDDWWVSNRVRDQGFYAGNIDVIRLIDTDLELSEIAAQVIGTVNITGGVYDSTSIDAIDNIGLVTADAYRNSTLFGRPTEVHINRISSSRNVGSIVTTNNTGIMADLVIDIIGTLTGRISAGDLFRVNIDVDNTINEINAANDMRASTIVTGRVERLNVGRNFRNTSMLVAGPISQVTVGNEISGLTIVSSGPDGRIGSIVSQGRFEATISSSGPIQRLESVNGDVVGSITTTDIDGTIGTLRAGRDILVDAMFSGGADLIQAGRHIGRRGDGDDRALDIRGNLGTLAAGGQIFADVLVGQNVTGTISSGRAVSKPGNDQVGFGDIRVFGRINALDFQGDVNSNITSYSGGIGSITITNGSFRKGKAIRALDGSLGRLTIIGGDLLGDVHADHDIGVIELLSGARNLASHIGISRFKSTARTIPGDSFRNELPPGTNRTPGADGPSISAGHNIGRIFLQNGSIYETTIMAGREIGEITVARGSIRNDELSTQQANFIIAGDRIGLIDVSGKSDNINIIVGIVSLGEDNAIGGVGAAADTVKAGTIGRIDFRKAGNNKDIHVAAGIHAGADGRYNTADDRLVSGSSSIDFVRIRNGRKSSIYSDGPIGAAMGGGGVQVKSNGRAIKPLDPSLLQRSRPAGSVAINPGVPFIFDKPNSAPVQVVFTGPGRAFYHRGTNRIILLGTTSESSLTLNARKNGRNNQNAVIRNLDVVTSNNASLGSLTIRGHLRGDSKVFIDGSIGTLTINRMNAGAGLIGAGGDIGTIVAGRVDAGRILGQNVGTLHVMGLFNGGAAQFLDLGTLDVDRTMAGTVSSDHDIDAVDVNVIAGGNIRAGGNIGRIDATRMNDAVISARDSIQIVDVDGEVNDSAIYAGVDLGRDADFGGSGLNADVISNGNIGSVRVGGGFPKSDLSAGVHRGADGFLGTADDVASDGRSTIGSVQIGTQAVGSNINSEQYRIISTGGVGGVQAGGSDLVSRGNFAVRELGAQPVPVTVTDLNVFEDSRVYRAEITFNQPIDASTLATALSIAEVRNGGATLVGLSQGSDYTVRYNSATNVATITFSRNVTDRSLPQQPGVPGPGLFRFILSGSLFRGASQGVLLDGNGDGATGDDYSVDAVVGDAGDKTTAGSNTLPGGAVVDFYEAIDLNILMDSNFASDNLPDVNRPVSVRGTVGDHPDANSNTFRAGGDVDLYRISLRAGQILVLGQMGGNARGAVRGVFDASGNLWMLNSAAGPQGQGGVGAPLTRLPAAVNTDFNSTGEDQILVNVTGTYYIAVSATLNGVDITDPTNIPNNNPVGGAVGSYRFDVTVFDDGNTGFAGDTDSGNGSDVVNAPLPIVFAGADQQFGTADDRSVFTTGRFNFTLDRGPDGVPNTADDVVSGTDGGEIVAIRRAGNDGQWGTADDEIRSTVTAAIGLPGAVGTPSQVAPDADVYRLNGGQPILPGTRIRFTLRLTESAGNIGLSPVTDLLGSLSGLSGDLLGNVQLALFELPAGTGFSNAKLVAAPSEFLPIGGQQARTVTDGVNSYGYDASGDFFMEIVLPGSQEVTGVNVPASYAIYVQGAIRSDYTLEILQQGTGSVQRSRQNVLIETRGGMIDWLEAAGAVTQIDAFDASVLGFAGQIDGIDVDDYIVESLIANLNSIFTAANVDITVSSDASAFESQDFSTVFLAGNTEPNAFFNDGAFGASEHVDMLNVDKNDQAVVFLPSLAQLGNDPSQVGVDSLVQSLTAAVGRRIGELIGLRITGPENVSATPSIMASNSIFTAPGGTPSFLNANLPLSGVTDAAFDTNFFLGTQNSLQLLQRIIRPRA